MCAPVLLNLLKSLGKIDKILTKSRILSLLISFDKFDKPRIKFNKTEALILDLLYSLGGR